MYNLTKFYGSVSFARQYIYFSQNVRSHSTHSQQKLGHQWWEQRLVLIPDSLLSERQPREHHDILNTYDPRDKISNSFGMCDQQRLRPACAYAQSDQSLCLSLEYSMSVKLPGEHHLEFLSLKGDCTGWSESTLVKMPQCWKSHVAAQL